MRTAAIWFGGLAVICVCFGLYYFGDHIGSLQPGATGSSFGQPWVLFEQGMQAILAGTWFYDYALAPLSPHALVVWVVLALFSAGAMASLAGGRSRSLAVSALAVSTLLIAVQNLLTPQATAGWHYISVYPFVTIVAAYGAYAIASVLPRRKASSYAALACVAASALTYHGLLMGRYFDALPREPANSA